MQGLSMDNPGDGGVCQKWNISPFTAQSQISDYLGQLHIFIKTYLLFLKAGLKMADLSPVIEVLCLGSLGQLCGLPHDVNDEFMALKVAWRGRKSPLPAAVLPQFLSPGFIVH